MQLNDILEENSIKMISQKTKISEENLESLVSSTFDALKKIQALGFISIIEREYKADLTHMREQALEFYGDFSEDNSIAMGVPVIEEKKGKSKLFLLFILLLLGVASWYFLSQFDKKHLNGLIPFIDEQIIENFIDSQKKKEVKVEEKVKAAKSIEKQLDNSINITQSIEDIKPQDTINDNKSIEKKSVSIIPMDRLWFGLIDIDTMQRDHFSVAEPYVLDVSDKNWLVATSSAPFSLLNSNETKEFNDAKEHYFKIDKDSITELSKSEYVSLGGWSQW